MLEIVDTNPAEPARILIYGDGGLGKSTLIGRADNPIIVAVEKGASRITNAKGQPVKMMRGIETWQHIFEAIKMLRNDKHDFKTVGFDSSTEMERLAHQVILSGNPGKSIITVDKGYGAGDKRSGSMHKELIERIEDLRINRNVNIIITGHQNVKAAKDPAMVEDYDTFEPKFQTKEPSGLWKEYVDACIFIRTTTYLKTSDDSKARALTDGSRTAFTTQRPSHYAKNRYGLPEEMPFTFEFWETLRPYLEHGPVQQQQIAPPQIVVDSPEHIALYKEILELTSHVPSPETQNLVMASVNENEKNPEGLLTIKQRLLEITGRKGA